MDCSALQSTQRYIQDALRSGDLFYCFDYTSEVIMLLAVLSGKMCNNVPTIGIVTYEYSV